MTGNAYLLKENILDWVPRMLNVKCRQFSWSTGWRNLTVIIMRVNPYWVLSMCQALYIYLCFTTTQCEIDALLYLFYRRKNWGARMSSKKPKSVQRLRGGAHKKYNSRRLDPEPTLHHSASLTLVELHADEINRHPAHFSPFPPSHSFPCSLSANNPLFNEHIFNVGRE